MFLLTSACVCVYLYYPHQIWTSWQVFTICRRKKSLRHNF